MLLSVSTFPVPRAPCPVPCAFCRYLEGNGVQLDVEAAAWYMACASSASYARYHLVGQQPIVEKQRLTEANEEVVSAGQLGEEDGLIQYQVQQSSAKLIKLECKTSMRVQHYGWP